MLNVKQLTEEYWKSIKIREDGEFVYVTPPFYHVESDESIALRFSELEDGRPIITDCGTTRNYLEIRNISLTKYRKKLDAIKERFFIEEENDAFIMVMPTDSVISVRNHVGCFVQAICVIANIDL